MAKELLRDELTKCRAYGQWDGYNLQALDRGMAPVILEQYGRTARGAQAIFNRIINHRLTPCPTRYTIFACKKGCQLRAVGPYFCNTAQSSMASPCGVHSQNRPGRSGRHPRQLAKLGASVSDRMSRRCLASALDHRPRKAAARTNVTTIYDILRQFVTFYDSVRLFVQNVIKTTQNVINRHKSS